MNRNNVVDVEFWPKGSQSYKGEKPERRKKMADNEMTMEQKVDMLIDAVAVLQAEREVKETKEESEKKVEVMTQEEKIGFIKRFTNGVKEHPVIAMGAATALGVAGTIAVMNFLNDDDEDDDEDESDDLKMEI